MKNHQIERKIYAFDCDIYGHLNNANYLKFYEEARAEYLINAGFSISNFCTLGIHIIVTDICISYKKETKLEEKIRISSAIDDISPAKIIWNQQIFNDANELCNTCSTTTVFSIDGKIKRINHEIIEKLFP